MTPVPDRTDRRSKRDGGLLRFQEKSAFATFGCQIEHWFWLRRERKFAILKAPREENRQEETRHGFSHTAL